MAQQIVNYKKVAGSDNVADMFTKALDSESLRRHTGGLQYEELAQEDWTTGNRGGNVNYIGSKPIGAEVQDAIDALVKDHGDLNAWTRVDLQTSTMRTTMKRGPDWKSVKFRITSDADSGKVLQIEESKDITRSLEHAPMSGGPRNLQTTLPYSGDGPNQNSVRDTTTSVRA